MIGLNADQGSSMWSEIASIAAAAGNWDKLKRARQLQELRDYSARFKL
jgi:hypothetical protein